MLFVSQRIVPRPSTKITERLDHAVARLLPRLRAGQKIDVNLSAIEHPRDRSDIFEPINVAWPVGQTCDYVWRLPNDSRVHAQCVMVDGVPKIQLHIDRWDPDTGLVNAVKHVLLETPVGPALGVIGVIALIARAANDKE